MTDFQTSTVKWVRDCMGDDEADNVARRARRFVEEALELAQSAGLTIDDVQAVAEYVYNRPKEPRPGKEVGGTMVTLAALCHPLQLSMEAEAWRELSRCWANIDTIRAKNLTIAPDAPVPAVKDEPRASDPVPDCPTCEQRMKLDDAGQHWVCTPCIAGLESEAWELYCDATSSNPHAATSWDRLPLIVRNEYIGRARAIKAQTA